MRTLNLLSALVVTAIGCEQPEQLSSQSAAVTGCWSVAAVAWRDDAIATQTAFTAEFDATPSAVNVDEVMGFSSGSPNQSFTNLEVIARFYTNGLIEARNGAAYTEDNTITYSAGTSYHFKFVVNVPTRTYSVYVTPSGGSQITLGTNYAFRSDAPAVNSLNNFTSESQIGTLQICNLSIVSNNAYNAAVLADTPMAFWGMTGGASTETDLSGHSRTGTYVGTPTTSTMPNGDTVAVFNGSTQYMWVASDVSLSIPNTHKLTWEAWIKPTTLQFPNSSTGYADFMGKCDQYSPTCEWEARMYDTTNPDGRCNRLSAYAFNPSAGEGAGADWQPTCGLLVAGHWYHVVGEYTTLSQPSDCLNTTTYPGSIDIWVNGVKWNHSYHGQTGCMSQYDVIPVANNSTLRVGTMANDFWFEGAIGKVAIYDYLLTQTQITAHYQAMTGQAPSGSCTSTCTLTNP